MSTSSEPLPPAEDAVVVSSSQELVALQPEGLAQSYLLAPSISAPLLEAAASWSPRLAYSSPGGLPVYNESFPYGRVARRLSDLISVLGDRLLFDDAARLYAEGAPRIWPILNFAAISSTSITFSTGCST